MPNRPHVAVTEDDPTVRALLVELLEEEGYRVSWVVTHDVAEVERLAPDLLLLDWHGASRGSGGALLARLKADPATAAIPAVLLTGAVAEVGPLVAALAAQGVAMVPKPFDLEALVAALAAALASGGTAPPARDPA